MPTLLIEMPSGVAGDMLLAALIDVGADPVAISASLDALGCGPLPITVRSVSRNGITAKQVDVAVPGGSAPADHAHSHGDHSHPHSHPHTHPHAHPHDHASEKSGAPIMHLAGAIHRPWRVIRDLIDRAAISAPVRDRAQRVFRLLAEAEGQVHGVTADDVEFHEVGSLDAIADVVGCCLALEQLGIDHVIAAPLRPGFGQVRCAHGVMPVPVPAVAAILARTGAPCLQETNPTGELTTPTGGALVCALADRWLGSQPLPMTIRRIGYGAGHRTIPNLANVLRVSLVDTVQSMENTVAELQCEVDDITGEHVAVVIEELLSAGALDAYLTPVLMKKGRPGYELTVLCTPADRERLGNLLLSRSTTIGVRYRLIERITLPRHTATVTVDDQTIRLKIVVLPDGQQRAKPEADDVLAACRVTGRDFLTVQRLAINAWHASQPGKPDASHA